MQVIKSGNRNIQRMLSPRIKENSIYRPSSYLLQLEADDHLLLHNTLTGELVVLSDTEKELFGRLPLLFCPELKELIGHHFVVSDEEA